MWRDWSSDVCSSDLFENLFNVVPVAESEAISSSADTDDAANVLIAVVKQTSASTLILDVQRVRGFWIA